MKLKTTQARAVHRLKIARGHLDKVIEMVDNGKYCIDILTQSQAVQAALKEVDAIILENHLSTCVSQSLSGSGKENAIAEVVTVFRRGR